MPAFALQRSRLAALGRASLLLFSLCAVTAATEPPHSAPFACAPGNGGLSLPAGFCAVVVARDLGPVRHLIVAPNGDVFANVQGQGIVALRDTTGDGVADIVARFGSEGGTGIALTDKYLYFSSDDAVYRYPWRAGQLHPSGRAEAIVQDLPATGDHTSKSIAVGSGDALFVNVGSATNSCQAQNRQPRSPGRDPCTELETRAGIWRFSASKPGQRFRDGERYATGLRNTVALAVDPASGALYGAVHGRDQLTQNWGYPSEKGAENPGEELVRIDRRDDFGWPYCYYDMDLKQHVLAPEYGGDGKKVERCAKAKAPLLAFPGHWGPMAIAVGSPRQFGAPYREGLFVAFHGSWNRSPLPQAGYRVAWVPFEGGRPTGQYSTFAAGTAGPTSLRASGLATGPDGSLYVAADGNTTIWRIVNSNRAAAQDAAAPTVGQVAPDFSLSAATRDGVRAKPVRLSELRGKTIVLAFFPKARTSGCTIQMTAYRDRYAELFHGGTDVVLLAISADPPEAQASWAKEAGFPFAFLSDASGDAGRLYGAWLPEHKLDKRSLFVVGPDGKISYTQVPFREVDAQAYAELGAAVAQASGAVRKATKS